MKKTRIDGVLLAGSVIGFLLMAASFVLMPLDKHQILPGAFFWGGLVIGIVLQIVLRVRNRGLFGHRSGSDKMRRSRVGILTFGSNPLAMIADCVMGSSLVATVLAFILTKGFGFICYVFIAITLFAFCLHCILNGRIFLHIKRSNPAVSGKKEGKYSR